MRTEHVLRIAALTLSVCGVLLLLAILWQLRAALVLLFLSIALSAALEPLIIALTERRIPRPLALTIVYAAVAIILVGLPVVLAAPLMADFDAFASHLTESQSQDDTDETEQPVGRIQGALQTALPYMRDVATRTLVRVDTTLWQILGFTWGAFEALGNLLVVGVLSIYWSADRDQFERLWLSLLSVERRAAARDLWNSIQQEIGAYLRSEAVQCLLAGTLLWLGYWLLGYPYPVLLATIGACAWLIPYAGLIIAVTTTFLLGVPTVITAGDHAIWTDIFPATLHTIVVLGALEYLIEPRVFDRRRYNSLLILLLVIIFTELFGISGLLLGPPIAAAIQLIGGYLIRRRATANSSPQTDERWENRLQTVRHQASQRGDSGPELVSLLDRLTILVREAESVRADQRSPF